MELQGVNYSAIDFEENRVFFMVEYLTLETAMLAQKSLLGLLLVIRSLPDDINAFTNIVGKDQRFPIDELNKVKKPLSDNKDAGESNYEEEEDDDDDDEDDEDEDDDEDDDDDSSDDDDDVTNANGGIDDEDDDDDDEDDSDSDSDEDDDDEDEEDEEEDEEEEQSYPPSKMKK